MKHLSFVLCGALAALLCGCGEPAAPPPTDPNAKATVIEEKPIFSEEERNAKIDADPSIPPEVKEALKSGAGKLQGQSAPNQGMSPSTGGQ